jgi:hypothetical protein
VLACASLTAAIAGAACARPPAPVAVPPNRVVPENIVACGMDVPLPAGRPVLSSTMVGDDLARGTCVRGSAPECGFTLSVPVRADVRLSLETTDFDGALVLLDARRTAELACIDDSPTGDTHHARIETTLAAGQYAVVVEGANGEAGQFALFAEVDPLPSLAEVCAAAVPLTPGVSVRGSTRGAANQFGASCAGGAQGPDRVHTFALAQPARVRVAQRSEHDGVLSLRAQCEDGHSELACDDTAAASEQASALLTAELAPGRYYVISDAFSRAQSGDYVLSLEEAPVPPRLGPEVRCGALPDELLRPGQYEIDTLDAPAEFEGSCGGAGAPERLFFLQLEGETTIQAELLEPEFDAVIYLRAECADERSELKCLPLPRRMSRDEGPVSFTATIGPGSYVLGVDGQVERDMGAARMRVDFLPMSVPAAPGGRKEAR